MIRYQGVTKSYGALVALSGLDLVVEGAAAKVSEGAELRRVADTFESKYGRHFTAPDGTWFGLGEAIRGGDALVYRVAPSTAFGFGKGRQFSHVVLRRPGVEID